MAQGFSGQLEEARARARWIWPRAIGPQVQEGPWTRAGGPEVGQGVAEGRRPQLGNLDTPVQERGASPGYPPVGE